MFQVRCCSEVIEGARFFSDNELEEAEDILKMHLRFILYALAVITNMKDIPLFLEKKIKLKFVVNVV